MQNIQASTATVTLTQEYSKTFFEKHVKQSVGTQMTGDRVKALMVTVPFVFRDLASAEVFHVFSIQFE
jgi:hypothetical protein